MPAPKVVSSPGPPSKDCISISPVGLSSCQREARYCSSLGRRVQRGGTSILTSHSSREARGRCARRESISMRPSNDVATASKCHQHSVPDKTEKSQLAKTITELPKSNERMYLSGRRGIAVLAFLWLHVGLLHAQNTTKNYRDRTLSVGIVCHPSSIVIPCNYF